MTVAEQRLAQLLTATAVTLPLSQPTLEPAAPFWAHDGLAFWASRTTDAALASALASPHALPHERAVIAREIEWRRLDDERVTFELTLAGRGDA